MLGKFTKLAPIPKPAPVLALTAILGTYVSKILKVAAAVNAIKFQFGSGNIDRGNFTMLGVANS